MLRSLQSFLDGLLAPDGQAGRATGRAGDASHRLQLATAVLLTEVMRASEDVSAAERLKVHELLCRQFALSDEEGEMLVQLADETQRGASDFHAFTTALNEQLDHAQKVQVIEAMWSVAYVDGHLAADENHVLWRVADLLHVPHGAYINAKIRAKAAANL